MKIVHTLQNYYPSIGGCQELFKKYSEGLVSIYDDEVTVITTDSLQSPHDSRIEKIPYQTENLNGVDIHRCSFWRAGLPLFKLINQVRRRTGLPIPFSDHLNLIRNGPISPEMFWAIVNTDVDIITGAASPYLHMFYPLWAKKWGSSIPFVYCGLLHIHDGTIPRPILGAIERADAYIALTDYERQVLIGKGISENKIQVIGAGIELERFAKANGQSIREKYGIGDVPVVAFIGRQAAYKGIDTLLYAMKTVWKKLPEAYLLIAGGRTPFSNQLSQIISTLSPTEQSRVIIIDNFTEAEKYHIYAACDLFVTISRSESFGIVYLEAWAAKKPVIGGRIGAVESLISENHDGLLVNCGQVEKLATAILSLLQNKQLSQRLAENGYTKVQREYSWPVVTRKLRRTYEHVLERAT